MEMDYQDNLAVFLFYLAYAWCAAGFFCVHLNGKQSEKRAFCGLLFCACAGIMLPLKKMGASYMVSAAAAHLLLILLAVLVFKGEKEKKVLAAVIVAVITELAGNFSESFLSVLWLLTVHRGTAGWREKVIGPYGVWIITSAAYAGGLVSVNLLSKPLIPVFTDKHKSWYLFLTLPLASVVLLTDLAGWAASNGVMVHDWGRYGLYENQLFSHGAMGVFTGLAMEASGFFVFGMEKIDREEKAREQYRFQVSYYQMVEEQYSQMERLRHDMKNHMIALGNLVKNGQWDVAGSYLAEMEKAGSLEAGDEATGSLVMDALLHNKKRVAKEKGICWQCDGKSLNDLPIKEIDLCVIVGNILDNALEACSRLMESREGLENGGGRENREEAENREGTETQEGIEKQEKPYIHVYMNKVRQCLLLEVRNSMDDGESRKLERNRGEKSGRRGLGLINVRAAAAKYNGTVRTEAEKGRFTISVLLPLYQE